MSKTLADTPGVSVGKEAHREAAGDGQSAPEMPTTAATAATPWPSTRTAYYTLFVLILCLTSNQLDVGIVPYLAARIKADLHLSDTNLGLLFGASFGFFYTLVGLPIAWFIDRHSRRWILALGIATWNIGTALCGVAQNFMQLFTARFLVGAGEGVNGPTSYSIVGDLFPRERMPRAIAFLQLGSVLGPALATAIGAWLLYLFLAMQPIPVFFGVIHGWQLIFLLIGLPSTLIAVLILSTVPEPARHTIPHQITQPTLLRQSPGARFSPLAWIRDFGDAFRYMSLHWSVFAPMFGCLAAGAFQIGALQWVPIFYQRTFGWGPAKLALLQSAQQLLIMPLGLVLGVMLAERLMRKRRDDAAVRVLVIARLIALPGLFYVLMPTPWLAFGLQALAYLGIGMGAPSQNAALQIVTPAELRGKVTALYIFLYSVVGVALAPIVTGLITDFVLHDESQIRWSIFWPTVIFNPLSLFIAWLGMRPYGREVARLKMLEA
ncbi:MAG TPA: MFS transporter [Steroidobacteraceae bacterium]|nr:MFS transporter [Steroidobacteraceae bacterium]